MTRDAIRPFNNKALIGPIQAWADATTDHNSSRRTDILRGKSMVVAEFFSSADAPPHSIRPAQVKAWQMDLEQRTSQRTGDPLSPVTIYAMISRVSSAGYGRYPGRGMRVTRRG